MFVKNPLCQILKTDVSDCPCGQSNVTHIKAYFLAREGIG